MHIILCVQIVYHWLRHPK